MKSAIITPRGKDTKDDRHDIKKIITMDEWCRSYQSTAFEQINHQLRKGKTKNEWAVQRGEQLVILPLSAELMGEITNTRVCRLV